MPIYEYECPSCGVFEVLEKPGENPDGKPINCINPKCNKRAKRIISPAAFHLKGTGWYKTDYASSGSSGANGSNGAKKNGKQAEPACQKDGGGEKPCACAEANKQPTSGE